VKPGPALAAALLLIACAAASRDVATNYAPVLGVDLQRMTRTASGLYWMDLQEGDGAEARRGARVSVLYIGYLTDGTRFDSAESAPLGFTLGADEVIRAWDEGIVGMKVGGRRRLVAPPSLGYGTAARGDRIPPNSTLVFDIQLVNVR
jgi:peptidylprolyl isomerase